MNLYLRTYTQVLADVRSRMRDTSASNKRWSDAEILNAINDSLRSWHGRVSIPALYKPVNFRWSSNVYEYDLPVWMGEGDIVPQMERIVDIEFVGSLAHGAETWVDLPGWTVEPSSTGGRKLRFSQPPPDAVARILYWFQPGQIAANEILSGAIDSASTSLSGTSTVDMVGQSGYIKIEQEYLQYSGVVTASGSFTLSNLVHSLLDSSGTSHTNPAAIEFCVAVPKEDLWGQLYDQVAMHLHRLFFANASPQERDMHGQMISLYENRIRDFWRRWIPVRPSRFVVNSFSTGKG